MRWCRSLVPKSVAVVVDGVSLFAYPRAPHAFPHSRRAHLGPRARERRRAHPTRSVQEGTRRDGSCGARHRRRPGARAGRTRLGSLQPRAEAGARRSRSRVVGARASTPDGVAAFGARDHAGVSRRQGNSGDAHREVDCRRACPRGQKAESGAVSALRRGARASRSARERGALGARRAARRARRRAHRGQGGDGRRRVSDATRHEVHERGAGEARLGVRGAAAGGRRHRRRSDADDRIRALAARRECPPHDAAKRARRVTARRRKLDGFRRRRRIRRRSARARYRRRGLGAHARRVQRRLRFEADVRTNRRDGSRNAGRHVGRALRAPRRHEP